MPSPIEVLLDPTALILIGIWLSLMALEFMFPGRQQPPVKGWRISGLLALLSYLLLSSYLPLFTDQYLSAYRLYDLSGLGTLGGAIAAVLVYELGVYLWHRAMHEFNFLWRTFHQMHHSAERLDTAGAFYFSPLDMVGWTLLGSFTMVFIIGVTPEAARVALFTLFFFSAFQHTNIRTPRWLGYFIQRPESHSIHHGRGIHRYNYSDLPVFDMFFGTFRNPQTFSESIGFYSGSSGRVADMLMFKDINANGNR